MPQTGTVGVFVAQVQNKKTKNSMKMNLQVVTNAVQSFNPSYKDAIDNVENG